MAAVRRRLDAAVEAAHRPAGSCQLLVVTKFFPADDVRRLLQLGERAFGESREPEAGRKVAEVLGDWESPEPGDVPVFDMIGSVQSKKARSVARWARAVHAGELSPLQALEPSRRLGDAPATGHVLRPDRGVEPVGGVVAECERLLLGVESLDGENRSEGLVADDRHRSVAVVEDGGGEEVAAGIEIVAIWPSAVRYGSPTFGLPFSVTIASCIVLSEESLRMPTLSALLVGTRSVIFSFSKRRT